MQNDISYSAQSARHARKNNTQDVKAPGKQRADMPFWVLLTFLTAILLMGGSSRGDITSLVILRPIGFAALAYGLIVGTRDVFAPFKVLLGLLLCLAAVISLQLVPLPPSIWTQLPTREIYSQIYVQAGIPLPWMGLAISPAGALNSLFSLVIPAAVIILFSLLAEARQDRLYTVIWIGTIASTLFGMLQLLGPENGWMYFYRISNFGMPVGFFANRNHQGLFVAIGILLSAYLAAKAIMGRRTSPLLMTAAAGAILLFLPFLLVNGSRAGLVLGAAMFVPSAYMIHRALNERSNQKGSALRKKRWVPWVILGGSAAIVAVLAAALTMSRSLALDRLIGKEIEADLRSSLLPYILDMAKTYLPFGSGFGSFVPAYKQIEPIELLQPSYINHAHNDWLEFIVEGGVPAAIILAGFIGWFCHAVFRRFFARGRDFDMEGFVGSVIILACGAASLADYPLRTPIMMAVISVACCHLARDRSRI